MNKRRQISQGKRDEIMAQTGGACYYCGYAANCIDHITPHSWAANDSEENLVAACDICNSIAGNKHFESLSLKKEYILSERASLKWRRKLSAMTVTVIKPASDIPTKRHKEIIDEPRRKSVNATASIIGEEKERQNKAIKPIAVKAIKEKKIQKPPEEPEQPKQLSEEEERDIHIQWLIDEVNELSDSEWDEVMSSRLYDKDGK